MKQSLWDLKHIFVNSFRVFLLNYEAIPMGFETRQSIQLKTHRNDYEAIPMGFETV